MSGLPLSIAQAFEVAMGELGFASAAWLFVREVADKGGEALVQELRDTEGRAFPVLDAIAAAWQRGQRGPVINLAPVLAACRGVRRLLIVGLEADFLDALLPRLEGIEIGLLRYSLIEVDWTRVQANYNGRATLTDMVSFQDFAGRDGAILTFLYSHNEHIAHVRSAWLRLIGVDVRAQFRSIIGWDVLNCPLEVYPRWLVETTTHDFSEIV